MDVLACGLLAVIASAWWLPGIDHPGMHNWDEAIHQAITRGVFDTFFYPHLWVEPLYPVPASAWWDAGVALHKPPGEAWLAALLMHVVGVRPAAARLVGFAGQLASLFVVYALSRRVAGRPAAFAASLGWLFLPFGWVLTQGHFFGDVIDCTLVGCVALSTWLLVRAAEREASAGRWAALAGVALGYGFLTKYVLALVPLGVAGVLTVGRTLGLTPGLRWRHLLVFVAAALAVAAPWMLYASHAWPAEFHENVVQAILGHATGKAGADVGPWRRPPDGVFVELLGTEFHPMPQPLTVLAGLALLFHALRRRDAASLAASLWLWATWVFHSFTAAKAPAHVWNAAPAVFVGMALLLRWCARSPGWAFAALLAAGTPFLLEWFPALSQLRALLPAALEQSRRVPGPVEGAAAMAAGGLLLALASRHGPLRKRLTPVVGLAGAGALLLFLFVLLPGEGLAQRAGYEAEALGSYTREAGLAVARGTPERSVLFQVFDLEQPTGFSQQESLFWSGRMTYRRPLDLPTASARGYHPWVVSSRAEPYAPLEGVPACAWLRVYDADHPLPEPAELPAEARLEEPASLGSQRLLGASACAVDGGHGRYALYVEPGPLPAPLRVAFQTKAGKWVERQVPPEASLFRRPSLAHARWYVLPVVGPAPDQVEALTVNGLPVRTVAGVPSLQGDRRQQTP